ncbi:MAG: GntR family transcriptional regulator [Candidatus Palauibacterales bacterium]|nr:GntR family transcriptional regulator [Candidatus Palauibacterales bacterium]MDP2530262.1 GntR family transcriptional regulator [Candidatus Palauibacterales bacterium]MDP2583047.1 GntR family transcriptional regulator [Candidatus Palauibacterales bacterium]
MSTLNHPQPLRNEVRRIVLERVLRGELAPGEDINETELAEQLGISRTPLREALLRLEHERLVGSSQGRGFYVWPLSAREAYDLYDVVAGLEGFGLRTVKTVPEELIEELRRLNERLATLDEDPRAMQDVAERWHETLLGAIDDVPLDELLDLARNRLHRYVLFGFEFAVAYGTDDRDRVVRAHRSIADALERGEMERAATLLEAHRRRGMALLERWLEEAHAAEATNQGRM